MIKIDFTIKPKEIIPEYITDRYGTKRLYDENVKFHSYNDLPAVIYPCGSKEWWKHGKVHRDNGLPAINYSWGRKEYWINGKHIK